jgi:hypothetical protein
MVVTGTRERFVNKECNAGVEKQFWLAVNGQKRGRFMQKG